MAQHNRVPITIRLDQFEGPLDLLLYLIQSHEMDISKVSISKITDQYLAYVRLMHELNFDVASDFLVMATTMLLWKSRAIIPKEESEDASDLIEENFGPTPEDLMRQLLEHQRFLAAGDDLGQIPRLGDEVFARPNGKSPVEKIWREMNITDLALGYQEAISTSRKQKQIMKIETISLADKIFEFADRLEVGCMMNLEKLMPPNPNRPEIVVTFLASLELSRLSKLRLHQEKTYATILIELLESLRGFNPTLAIGFEAEIRNQFGLGGIKKATTQIQEQINE